MKSKTPDIHDLHPNMLQPMRQAVILLLGLLFLLVVLIVIFRPFSSRSSHRELGQLYQLPEFYTQEDLVQILEDMSRDQGFHLYFETLTPADISAAADEVFDFLEHNRNPEQLKKEILRRQEEVERLALAFGALSYPAEFFDAPLEFDDLTGPMWSFLTAEFKATILAICYQMTYDKSFSFEWRNVDGVHAASAKLKEILPKLSPEQKKAIAKSRGNP